MWEILKSIDKNQDGKLDLKELKALQKNLKKSEFKEKIFKKIWEDRFLSLLKKQRKELGNPDAKKIVDNSKSPPHLIIFPYRKYSFSSK